ncbi:MAG: hypothetical protein HZA01_02045 [Nitrospinae bacterium]|nr:hypothetical protein [Nitrospinota bacterium]
MIDPDLRRKLDEESKLSGEDPNVLAEELIRRGLTRKKLARWREKLVPKAKAAGFADDDTIMRAIS